MAFLIFLTVELGHGFGWLNDYGIARFSFILAGLWWIIFGLPFLKNAHQRYSVPKEQKPIVASFARVIKTMRHIRQYRAAFWFLVAYFFYIDGVDTIFTMATSIGSDMGIDTTMLMVVLLVVQLIAFPFSIWYGWLIALQHDGLYCWGSASTCLSVCRPCI